MIRKDLVPTGVELHIAGSWGCDEPSFCLPSPLDSKNLPEDEIVEKTKKPHPEEQLPEGEGGLDHERSDHSVPVDKSQDEYKKDKEQEKASQRTIPPEIAESDKEKGETFS